MIKDTEETYRLSIKEIMDKFEIKGEFKEATLGEYSTDDKYTPLFIEVKVKK